MNPLQDYKSQLDRIREDGNFSRRMSVSNYRNGHPYQNNQYIHRVEDVDYQVEERLYDIDNELPFDGANDDDNSHHEELNQQVREEEDQEVVAEERQEEERNHLAAYRYVAERVATADGAFDLSAYVQHLHRTHFLLPNDYNQQFLPGENAHTKQSAASVINNFCWSVSLNESEQKDLLEMLNLLLPNARLPLRHSKQGNIINELSKYSEADNYRCLVFDCCPCGKCVYTGNNKDMDRCEIEKCPYGYRYTPCKVCKSEGRCDHFSARVAKSVLHYTPFTGIVFDLLSEPGFLAALHYVDLDDYPDMIQDIHNGREYLKAMADMRLKFEETITDNDIKPLNLALAVFFDGSKVFNRKSTTFIPLVVSILNLPPAYRSVVGNGSFTLTICTFKDGTCNQDFILKDCFVNELLGLYTGVLMQKGRERYFVQSRVVIHGYDTRALQPMLRVRQESKTLVRCPLCNSVNNYLTGHFPKLGVYEGHRRMLPLRHYLRMYGQSGQCCPRGQYQCNDLLLNNEDVFANNKDIRPLSLVQNFRGAKERREGLNSCSPEYQENGASYQDWNSFKEVYILDTKSNVTFEWFHALAPPVFLSEHLYYPCCDYRVKHEYKRITNEQYLRDANEAIRTGSDCNGVYASWLFASLPYADVSNQVCWCCFHTLLNVAKYVLTTFQGERSITREAINYCKQSGTHPYFYEQLIIEDYNNKKKRKRDSNSSSSNGNKKSDAREDDCKPPYVLRKQVRRQIEEFVDLIYIPKGHREHYQVKRIFSGTGELHGHAKIQVITVLMEFIMWLIRKLERDYPTAYIVFHLMLTEDIQFLQRLAFSAEDLDRLPNLIVETVETHTALYPPTESKIIWHQLVDISHFIAVAGPIRGWWTLPMERALSKIKQNVPKGGSSYYITTFRRQMKQEQNKLKQGYDISVETLSDKSKRAKTALHGPLSKGTAFISPQGLLWFSDKAIKMMKRSGTGDIILTPLEYDLLLNHLVDEVLQLCDDREDVAIRNSCLFRLFKSYRVHHQMYRMSNKSFWSWMTVVKDIFLTNNKTLFDEQPSDCRAEFIQDTLSNGDMFLSDFEQLRRFWLRQDQACRITPYKNAIIYGVYFSSRGYEYSEVEEEGYRSTRYGSAMFEHVKKACNLLRNNLSKNEYSAWFSETERTLAAGEERPSISPHAGQFNYFFRLSIPNGRTSDPMIDQIPLGCAVMRKTERISISVRAKTQTKMIYTQMLTVDCTKEGESYYSNKRFVSLTNVQATAYGVFFLSRRKDGLPVSTTEILRNPEDLHKILLLPLDPSRAASVKFIGNKREFLYHNSYLDDDNNDNDE